MSLVDPEFVKEVFTEERALLNLGIGLKALNMC